MSGNLLSQIAAGSPGIDMTGAFYKANSAANLLLQNQRLQALQAAGQAYQQATDPVTGQVDTGKAQALIAANPDAAFAAQPSATSGQALQQAQQTRGLQAQSAVNQGIASLLALPSNQQTPQNYARVIQSLPVTDQDKQAALQEVQAAGNDPVALMQVAARHLTHNLGAPEVASTFLPKAGMQVTGSQATPYVAAPAVGAFAGASPGSVQPAAGGLSMDLSPGQAGQPVTWMGSDGRVHNGTMAQYDTERGLGRIAAGAAGMPQSGGQSGGQVGQAGGALPSPANPPRLPGAGGSTGPGGSAAGASGAGPGGQTSGQVSPLTDTTGPAPGQDKAWAASADQYNTDRAAAGSFQDRVFPIAQSLSLLNSGVQTGEGSEAVNRLKSWLTTRFPGDAQTIATSKFQELNKYLTRLTNSNPMAAASDARLASALAGNPNAHLNTLANKDVLSAMLGLERMHQMAFTDATAQGVQPAQYADFMRNWAGTHDPRAFIFDQMDQARRTAMVNGMSPSERQSFANTLGLVQQHPELMNLTGLPH